MEDVSSWIKALCSSTPLDFFDRQKNARRHLLSPRQRIFIYLSREIPVYLSLDIKDNISVDLKDIVGMSMINMTQPRTTNTLDEIERISNEKHQSQDFLSNPQHSNDHLPRTIDQKQKSLLSIYDNNPQQYSSLLIGILGRNLRSQAFTKRLLLSGFAQPILCDLNSTEIESNYITFEKFYDLSPAIVLITDNLSHNFEDLFPRNCQQLIVDTREIVAKSSSTVGPSSIPGAYRAFGNLSNWEIENGTHRIGVAVEQPPPSNLIKFIYDLNCFSRGITYLDQFSYDNHQSPFLHRCLLPLISTAVIFSACFLLSFVGKNSKSIFHQASAISASTSITLLALVFLIRPLLEIIEFIHPTVSKNSTLTKSILRQTSFVQSRHYFIWYSLLFACLHILFSMYDVRSKVSIFVFFLGLCALLSIVLLSFVYFPWVSERLPWKEYHLLTSTLAPISLLVAFIHLFLHWTSTRDFFNFQFLSLLLPSIVLLFHFFLYGLIPLIRLCSLPRNRVQQ